MPAKKENKYDGVKNVLYIIIASITIAGTILGVEKYFAKSSAVAEQHKKIENGQKLIDERLDISIIDDQIFQQQQQIQRIEDFSRFEQKTVEPELTQIEKETLDKGKERLFELKNRKLEKIKNYEERRNK